MSSKAPYKINRIGAGHSQQEGGPNSEFKMYGFGDQIMLDPAEVTSGKWSHLLPSPVIAGRVVVPKPVAVPDAEEDLEDVTNNGEGDNGEDPDKGEDAAITPEALEALITKVEEAEGKEALAAVRAEIIAADLFEEETVPKTKAALIQSLATLRT